MSAPRILFLLSGRNAPATRYRILPYLPHLKAAGFHCEVAFSYPQKYQGIRWIGWRASQMLKLLRFRWTLFVAKFRRYDIVYIEREIFDLPTWDLESRFRKLVPLMVLDVDDAIFLRYPEKFAAVASMCDLIVVGNPNLEEVSRNYQQNIVQIPTSVEVSEYVGLHESAIICTQPEKLLIGWIGTESNLSYLKSILPALNSLAKTRRFQLRVITGPNVRTSEFEDCEFEIEFRLWNASTAVQEISEFTVGVMPLPDEEWQRYKCGFKLLQYMAAGVPAVASPVGVNAEIIEHGINGLLAKNDAEWLEMLRQLMEQAELRQRLASAAIETVASKYSISVNAEALIQALRNLLQSHHKTNSESRQ